MGKGLIVLVLLFASFFAHGQQLYCYTPEGKTSFTLSRSSIIVKFKNGVSYTDQLRLLKNEKLIEPFSEAALLPAPKVTMLRLKAGASQKRIYNLLARLEAKAQVVYANPVIVYKDKTRQAITDRFIVKLKSKNDLLQLQSIADQTGTRIVEQIKFMPDVYVFSATKHAKGNALEMANYFTEQGLFEYAEPDFLRFPKKLNTNDPLLPQQWALNNSLGNSADMRVFQAWNITTGSATVKVAILDEGVELTHPDLSANITGGYDATGQGSGGNARPSDTHGTHCAGIAAAIGNNGIGTAGVAYNSRIIPVRIAYGDDANPGYWVLSTSWVVNGINYAWQTAGADVLSNSYRLGSSSSSVNAAIDNATSQGRSGKGAMVLCAAGNNGVSGVSYPASYAKCIAVGSTDQYNYRSSFSNYGTSLSVSAPGTSIYATLNGGTYGIKNGTSMACPNAAGVVALMYSVNPNLTRAQARAILEESCDKVGGYSYTFGQGSSAAGSWSAELGYGRVNAYKAVLAAGSPNGLAIYTNPLSACVLTNQSFEVPFSCTGTFTAGNVFTAQLSDATGSFATNPITIGTLTGTGSGEITALIPAGTVPGSSYRIRVVASAPATSGTANETDITLYANPFTSCPGNQVINTSGSCDAVVNFTAVTSGASAVTYSFSGATTGSGNGTGSGSVFNIGTTTVTLSTSSSCGQATCIFSVIVSDGVAPVIAGCPANITATAAAGNCGAAVTFANPTATDNCVAPSTNASLSNTNTTWTNSGLQGVFFDVTNTSGKVITISSISTGTVQYGGYNSLNFSVYTTNNAVSFLGNQANAAAWTLNTTQSVAMPADGVQEFRTLTLATPLILQPGQTRGMYVVSTVAYGGGPVCYQSTVNGYTGGNAFQDGILKVSGGLGTNGLFQNFSGTAGSTSNYRLFYGAINYASSDFSNVTLTQTSGLPSGSVFPAGTTTNTFTATDGAGNSATCSFDVTVTPNLNVTAQASASSILLGNSVTLSVVNPQSGYTYSWSGIGLNSNSGNSVTATPTATGSFAYVVSATNGSCAVTDQVTVAVQPTVAGDAGITRITRPLTKECLSSAELIRVRIRNFGTTTLTSIPVQVQVTGAVNAVLSATYSGSLAVNDSVIFDVGYLDFSLPGTYAFTAQTVLANDAELTNDDASVTHTQESVQVLPLDQVSFAGFTGVNLNTLAPGLKTGKDENFTNYNSSTWTGASATQITALGSETARIRFNGTTKRHWIEGPKFVPTDDTRLFFEAAVTTAGGVNYAQMGTSDELRVLVSTDCGQNYTPLYLINRNTNLSQTLTLFSLELEQFKGQEIRIAFMAYEGSTARAANFDLHLDNIQITTPDIFGTVKSQCLETRPVLANGNNEWKELVHNGRVVGSINDQGKNLGAVNISFHLTDAAVTDLRTDEDGKPLLSRYFKINATNSVFTGEQIGLRLYVLQNEISELTGKPGSGVASVNDLAIMQYSGQNENCNLDDNQSATASVTEYHPYQITKTPYRNGYLLEVQVQDHLSEFYLKAASAQNPLPVTMVYFKATKQGKDALLEWQTALEEDNAGFVVEVSDDMEHFRQLGFVNGKGSNSSYQFTDTEAGKQTTRYYRLKQLDTGGTFAYSVIRVVNFGEAALTIEVWPNPFRNQLSVQLHAAAAGKLEMQLTDVLGRVVTQKTEVLKAGDQVLELALPDKLADGMYLLQLQDGRQKIVLKVMKN